MQLCSRLMRIIFTSERQWTGKQFLFFLSIYLTFILLLALPDGSETLLAPYGAPNPECVQKLAQENVAKKCSPSLYLFAHSTAKEYISFWGGADSGSYVRGGLLLAVGESRDSSGVVTNITNPSVIGRLNVMNEIGYGMWPPGMFFLNAIPLSISTEIPLGLYQVIVVTVLWAAAFALVASILALRIRLWLAIISPLFITVFPLFHDYLIRYGVMYSETYGAALMSIGFTFLVIAFYRKPSNTLMFASGVIFALASFIRSQMLPVSMGVSIILILSYLMQKRGLNSGNAHVSNPLKLVTIITFLIGFYLPIGSYMIFNKGALFHADYMWEYPFKIPEFPNAGVANFVALGGIRAACDADLEKCKKLHEKIKDDGSLPSAKAEVLKTFIYHPIRFGMYKLPIAWKYWMEDIELSGHDDYRYYNVFILFLFLACLSYMVIRKLWFIFWITISTLALFFGPPFLLHFEARYYYLTKVFILFLPIWLIFIESPKVEKS